MYFKGKYLCIVSLVIFSISGSAYTTQRTNDAVTDEGSPFLDMASEFLSTLGNQQGGGGGGGAAAGLSGIASMLLPLMANANSGGGKSAGNDGMGAILSGIGSMLAAGANGGGAGGGGGGGFDPALIGNVIQMFAGAVGSNADDTADEPVRRQQQSGGKRQKRKVPAEQAQNPLVDTVLTMASSWLANYNNVDQDRDSSNGGGADALVNLLVLPNPSGGFKRRTMVVPLTAVHKHY